MSHPPTTPPPPAGPTTPPPPAGPKRSIIADELYPVSELATMWRCSPGHIYDLIARGELRHIQLGTGRAKTRIPASAAAEFVARRSSKGRSSKGRAA
jgi:excisionase family DNA binding protein